MDLYLNSFLHMKEEAEDVGSFRARHEALLSVHLQPKTTFDEPNETLEDSPCRPLAPDEDLNVVGVANEAQTSPVQFPVQLIQHDIGEEGGKWAPCGVPCSGTMRSPVGITTLARRIR